MQISTHILYLHTYIRAPYEYSSRKKGLHELLVICKIGYTYQNRLTYIETGIQSYTYIYLYVLALTLLATHR